jgi:hypothetical protein
VAVVAVVLFKAPQAPATVLLQVADQVTPAESLVTVAVRAAVALVRSVGGAPASLTEINSIVMVAVGEAKGADTDAATTVTVLPMGTTAGAV